LIASGAIPRGSDLKAVIRAAYQHQAHQAAGRAGSAATSAARTKSLEASAKLKDAQRHTAKQRLKKQAGELLEYSTHAGVLSIFRAFRTSMLAVPSRINAAVPTLAIKDRDKVKDILHGVLNDLASMPEAEFLRLMDCSIGEDTE